jgi:hypothetical protein
MGNQMWKWLSSTESITKDPSERRRIKQKNGENSAIVVRSLWRNPGSTELGGNVTSFLRRNLPLKTVENNKHFYIHPDNSEFLEIIRNKKVKALPLDYSRLEIYFENELEQSKASMLHYASLLSNDCNMPQDESKLLVEIIAGYDINLTK